MSLKNGHLFCNLRYLADTAPLINAVHDAGATAGVTIGPCPFFYPEGSPCWGGANGRYHQWHRNLSAACQGQSGGSCPFDSVIAHNYITDAKTLTVFTPEQVCNFVVISGFGSNSILLTRCVIALQMLSAFLTIPQVTMDFGAASMARDFADGLTLWVTEFNTMYADVWSGKADADHPAAAKFLNSTENSAAHAVHVAAYILAAMGHGRLVETMNYHSFMEGAGASSLGPHTDGGSQPGFATVAINASGSYISPVAQVLSTLAGWLGEPGATMEAVPQTGSSEVLPFTLAKAGLGTKTHTCIHAAAICARSATAENVAGEDRLIAINRCDHPVEFSLASLKAACGSGASGWAAVQTYDASVSVDGPGHTWAKTAGPSPWGPLKPAVTGAGAGAPTLDAYSLSSVTLKMDDPSSALAR